MPIKRWPTTVEEAEQVQRALRPLVSLEGPSTFRLVAGLDVHYYGQDDLTAAVVLLDGLDVVEQVTVQGKAAFPYVPGLFAFREIPALLEALDLLQQAPELLVCDGYGLAHPRRFGLACHLGVLTGLPALGVGKTRFTGESADPGQARGSWAPITLDGEVVGRALRTQDGVKPVYVSQGHRIGLDTVCEQVLRLTPRFRLPEPIRQADRLARRSGTGSTPTRPATP